MLKSPSPTSGIAAKLGANVNGDSPAELATLFDIAVVVDGCGDSEVDIALADGSLGSAGVLYVGDVMGTGDAGTPNAAEPGSDDGDVRVAEVGLVVIPAEDGAVENGAGAEVPVG